MIISNESRIKGGKSAAKIVKEKHLNRYLENPNFCLFCGIIILPKNNETATNAKRKKFCNHSCSAKYSNKKRGYELNSEKIIKNVTFRIDEDIPISLILGEKASKYSQIRAKARAKMIFYKVAKECIICGYDKHVEVHHKNPCNSYSNDTLLSIVNSLDNLVYLCPNHHWEVEHKIIKL